MAAPHGVKLKDLKCDFMDNTAAQAHQDAQFEFGKHDVPVFDLDVGKISDALSLHGSLDPSILSIFQEKIGTESVESEASLLSALSEILDSVDVETLSPFDVLPDAEIFSARKNPNHTLRNLLDSDRAAALQCPKISQSPASKSGKEVVISDRQLRPRRHLETQSKISQRADDEKNPRENKRSARSFRIESDTIFPQDEREILVDLVRHMHPYCIRTDLENEKEVRVSVEEEEEEEFVDVEGYEEPEENQSGQGLDPKGESGSYRISKSEEDRDKDVCRNRENISFLDKSVLVATPLRSALLKTREKNRKTVTFAVNLTLVHEIPPDDESDSDLESTSSKSDITSPQKPKALSLQQYRLLRQNKQPREETRMDYRTKWPSLPDIPRELPAILPDLFKIDPKLNLNSHCGAIDKAPTVEVKISASQPREITRSSHVKLRTAADLCTDPPNPVLVPLKPTLSSGIKTQPALTDSKADVCVSCEEVRLAEVVPVIIKATDSPTRTGSEPPAPVLMPTSVAEKRPEGQQNQNTCGDIGIEATDLTSLLEQFETQASEGQNLPEVSRDEHQERRPADLSSTAGLTPPATPPHQTWKPPVPVKSMKSSKTIQIIEPRPLPPSKTHSKLPSFTPASNPAQLFLDHDYCGIQGSKTSFDSVSSPCDYRVLLSPDSSPCRINTFEEAESLRGRGLRFSAPSPSPLDRGRRKRRGYDVGYRRSSSRSSCSTCSSSSSSSSSSSRSRSRSPPRKRYRSRHSGSSSSSRSSSRSSSPPPPPERRSRSRSLCGSRSGSHSPQPDWSESRCTWKSRRQKELNRLREEARKLCQQKAIEERRVVYVGGIRGNMSASDLTDRFSLFGKVEDCTIHIRSHGDNYGFVTYYSRDAAYAAIENGSKLRRSDELPFDLCFGGRRQFCKSNYADLDSNRDADGSSRSRCESFDFDTLLKQAQRQKR
ncbi:peroxisome proliferator-activated receptor gamma coactivator-related protein 1-like [Siphateles boraxobius]|uniref:peroxisome proliferator-activated receptor gamma coactivator-related protein 1-like n=1 Tax=Siphateles boraxobius TaxID=180520 RepID=UPI004064C49D